MNREDKIIWMLDWCDRNKLTLQLQGFCGFGRECVGVSTDNVFPDYVWYDDNYKRADKNGDVWVPEDAYHKHPCVCVLGRGEEAEDQLYQWLNWFEENGFVLKESERVPRDSFDAMFNGRRHYRMVRKAKRRRKNVQTS